jgi:hypothetical protein
MQLTPLEKHLPAPAIILAGVLLSLAGALVPYHGHAITLLPLQAAAGILPYVLYGIIAHLLREPIVIRAGVLVFAVHLGLTLLQRGLGSDQDGAPLLVAVPLLATAALLVLLRRALQVTALRDVSARGLPEQGD